MLRNKAMNIIWNSSLILGTLFLFGCDSQIDAVNQEMAQIRSQAPQRIEPAPTFSAVPSFEYSAQNLRSPFLPSSIAHELKMNASKPVQPNLQRKKHPLERYALEELYMKGSLVGHHSIHRIGLLQTPDGQLEQVHVGDYIGQHQGRIFRIGPTQIDLVELMDDGRGGFVQRPRSLMLIQAGAATHATAQAEAAPIEQPATAPVQQTETDE